MRKPGANTSRPARPRATRLAPDNPSSENTTSPPLQAAVSSASQAITQSEAVLAAHWENIRTAFVASDITTPFADWLTQAFGSQHTLITIVRAAFANHWRQIEESCSRQEVGRRRSAATRLGLDEIWHLYLWFGASVQSQRCWRLLPQGSKISARELFVELCRVREQQPRGKPKHYLEKSFVPREFEAACRALFARDTIQDPVTRDESNKQDNHMQCQLEEQQQVEHERVEEEQADEQEQAEDQERVVEQKRVVESLDDQRERVYLDREVEEQRRVEEHKRFEEQSQQVEFYRRVSEYRRQIEEQRKVEQQQVEEYHRDKQRLEEQRAFEQQASETARRQHQFPHDDSGFFDDASDSQSEKHYSEDDSGVFDVSDIADMDTRSSSRALDGIASPRKPSTDANDFDSSTMADKIAAARVKLDEVRDDCAAKKWQWEKVAQTETAAVLRYKRDIDACVSSIMEDDVEDSEQGSCNDDSAGGLGDLGRELKAAVSRKRKASRQIESLAVKSQRLDDSRKTMLAQFDKALEDHLERMREEEETIVAPGADQ